MPTGSDDVKVSVIIATRNRAGRLAETLAHLGGQVTSFAWEIIVVDNGSTDRTQQAVQEAAARSRMCVRGLSQPVPGKNRALNIGIEEARGELLVFTDDDVVMEASWLAEIVRATEAWSGYDIFCGPIHPLWPRQTPEWLKVHPFAIAAFSQFTPPHIEGPVEKWTPFGPNFAVRRAAVGDRRFAEVIGASSGTDTRYPLGDETEFLYRLRDAGSRTVFVPAASVGHQIEPHQLDWQWLMNRSFRNGRGHVACEPDETSVRLWGAPRYLWLKFARAWVRRALARGRGEPERFNRSIELEHLRGQIYEHRSSR